MEKPRARENVIENSGGNVPKDLYEYCYDFRPFQLLLTGPKTTKTFSAIGVFGGLPRIWKVTPMFLSVPLWVFRSRMTYDCMRTLTFSKGA
jgi:hypothetical protein